MNCIRPHPSLAIPVLALVCWIILASGAAALMAVVNG